MSGTTPHRPRPTASRSARSRSRSRGGSAAPRAREPERQAPGRHTGCRCASPRRPGAPARPRRPPPRRHEQQTALVCCSQATIAGSSAGTWIPAGGPGPNHDSHGGEANDRVRHQQARRGDRADELESVQWLHVVQRGAGHPHEEVDRHALRVRFHRRQLPRQAGPVVAGGVPRGTHAEPGGASGFRVAGRGNDLLGAEQALRLQTGVVARRLRAVGAVLGAAAGLDRHQRRPLDLVGVEPVAVNAVRIGERVVSWESRARPPRT